MSDNIKIYPSNWLYNAGVVGFLKVIAHAKGEDFIEKWLNDDGSLSIDKKIFTESLNFYKDYNKKKGDKELPLIGKNRRYPNYLQSGEESAFESFCNNLQTLKEGNTVCGLCSLNFDIDWSNLDEKAKKVGNRISSNLKVIHNSLIAPSLGEFPNAFWNLNHSIPICPLCAYFIIHHHIPLENAQTLDGQIFINAPSFKVMWYLNKFAENLLNKEKKYELRKILGISLMEFAQRVSVTLGVWSLMNIEMVIKSSEKINYYALPVNIAKILLQKDIASLINATREPLILEIILNGEFQELITLSHRIIRQIGADLDVSKDKYISKLKNTDKGSLERLVQILPELYVKIDSIK